MSEIQAWKARVKAVGHGTLIELDSRDALDIARAAGPKGELTMVRLIPSAWRRGAR
jgi:hypothetical protein